jgi:hypothetical protein
MFLAAVTASAQCPVTIDNFSTGPVRSSSREPFYNSGLVSRPALVPGGMRWTRFNIGANPFGQVVEMDIAARHSPALVVSMPVRAFNRLEIFWGLNAPLGIRPAGCDRFRVTFDSSTRIINFNAQAFSDGALYQSGINMGPSPATAAAFCVDFPFSTFATSTPGATQDFAGKGIDYMDLIFQVGDILASDFVVTKFEIVSGASSPAPCQYVATRR